jgi:hypothetical protein
MEPKVNTFLTALRCNYPPAYTCRFRVGDTVRLKTGKSPMRVTDVSHTSLQIKALYLSSRREPSWRSEDDFVLYQDDEKTEKETEMTHKLYKTLDGARYGEYRAKDGDKVLLLMSDSGSYEAFAPEAIKRVMPYTYDVAFSGTGKVYSYVGTEGEVVVGDLLLGDSMTVARVVAVNTESESATKRFNGVKLMTVPLAS